MTEDKKFYMEDSKIFLAQHTGADELIYNEKTKIPVAAIYFNAFYPDEIKKAEILNLIKKYIPELEK